MDEQKLGMRAYLFRECWVVFDKSEVKNATDDEFKEVTIFVPVSKIEEMYSQLEYVCVEEDKY